MLRNAYFWLAILAIAGGAALFFFRTSAPPAEPPPTAEFGGVSLSFDYASTEAAREKGLGGRTSIPDNYGMLFVFPKDGYYGFWMKDTLVPLDMFWLNAQGQVVYIAPDVATSSFPDVFYPTAPARYVLETAAGFARAHAIKTGTPLLLKNFPTVLE
ncbi:MAG: hypothetical protein B7W96_00010 [Parcubacteria group bacterium 37-58-5]|nr:MAG: hypothetical protein B7W96_00010 [Parcubacteria group bacterium 37-58-5]